MSTVAQAPYALALRAIRIIARNALPLTTEGAAVCESLMRPHGEGNTNYLRSAIHMAQEAVREVRP